MSDTQAYNSLLDSDPYLQQKVALERTLVRNQALQSFRDAIVRITRNRFPALTEMVQQRVLPIQELEELQWLVIQIAIASDEAAARRAVQEIKPG